MRRDSHMLKLHPEVLRRDGKDQFVVLPYEEFVELKERLEDALDLINLREAKRTDTDEPGIPMEEVLKRFGITEE
jgi:hypothetical protein